MIDFNTSLEMFDEGQISFILLSLVQLAVDSGFMTENDFLTSMLHDV